MARINRRRFLLVDNDGTTFVINRVTHGQTWRLVDNHPRQHWHKAGWRVDWQTADRDPSPVAVPLPVSALKGDEVTA